MDYLPDSLSGKRLGITELLVHAATLDQAKAHALRVTRGLGSVVTEIPLPTPTSPVEEVSSA